MCPHVELLCLCEYLYSYPRCDILFLKYQQSFSKIPLTSASEIYTDTHIYTWTDPWLKRSFFGCQILSTHKVGIFDTENQLNVLYINLAIPIANGCVQLFTSTELISDWI